jgi:hypothetical protein
MELYGKRDDPSLSIVNFRNSSLLPVYGSVLRRNDPWVARVDTRLTGLLTVDIVAE